MKLNNLIAVLVTGALSVPAFADHTPGTSGNSESSHASSIPGPQANFSNPSRPKTHGKMRAHSKHNEQSKQASPNDATPK